MKIVIELTDKEKEMVDNSHRALFADVYSMMANKIKNGKILPKGHDVDTLLQKATDEVFVQCKQFNERFSKDWNEGFNDGMFHTLTIIKEIIKADKEVEHDSKD